MSDTGGKNAGKETKGDKNRKPSGKDKETKEPNTRPHVPFSRLAEGTLRVDPSTIWDYKASSVHSVSGVYVGNHLFPLTSISYPYPD